MTRVTSIYGEEGLISGPDLLACGEQSWSYDEGQEEIQLESAWGVSEVAQRDQGRTESSGRRHNV